LVKSANWSVNKIKLDSKDCYPVLVIAIDVSSPFLRLNFLGGNGFLAVNLCAVYLGKPKPNPQRKTILKMLMDWLG